VELAEGISRRLIELSSSWCQNISNELLSVGFPDGSSFILSDFVTVNLQNLEKVAFDSGVIRVCVDRILEQLYL
jgi:hypothetical protein